MFLLSLCLLSTTFSFSSQAADWFPDPQDENPGGKPQFSSPNGAFASPDSPLGLLPNQEAATNGQIAGSETFSKVINAADRQDIAFQEGDGGVNFFPWNLIPALDGDWIELPSLFDGTPLPTIDSDYPSPQAGRYDDNERLTDPKTPNCDGGKIAMCCSVPAPMQPLAAHNVHKRRRCYLCMVS